MALSQQLFGDFANQANEQFGAQFGLGVGDSDFEALLAGEAGGRSTELAELAQQRRLAAATGIGDQASQIIGLQGAGREAAFAQSDAGQILNQLLSLSGISTQGQQTGTDKSRRKGGGVFSS